MSNPLRVVGAVIVRGEEVLACRRREGKSAAGKWEFPGGKIESGESPQAALARELKEELGLEPVKVGPLVAREVTSVPGSRDVDLACYLVEAPEEPMHSSDHDIMQWRAANDLGGLEWADPDWPAVNRLEEAGVAGIVRVQ